MSPTGSRVSRSIGIPDSFESPATYGLIKHHHLADAIQSYTAWRETQSCPATAYRHQPTELQYLDHHAQTILPRPPAPLRERAGKLFRAAFIEWGNYYLPVQKPLLAALGECELGQNSPGQLCPALVWAGESLMSTPAHWLLGSTRKGKVPPGTKR